MTQKEEGERGNWVRVTRSVCVFFDGFNGSLGNQRPICHSNLFNHLNIKKRFHRLFLFIYNFRNEDCDVVVQRLDFIGMEGINSEKRSILLTLYINLSFFKEIALYGELCGDITFASVKVEWR